MHTTLDKPHLMLCGLNKKDSQYYEKAIVPSGSPRKKLFDCEKKCENLVAIKISTITVNGD